MLNGRSAALSRLRLAYGSSPYAYDTQHLMFCARAAWLAATSKPGDDGWSAVQPSLIRASSHSPHSRTRNVSGPRFLPPIASRYTCGRCCRSPSHFDWISRVRENHPRVFLRVSCPLSAGSDRNSAAACGSSGTRRMSPRIEHLGVRSTECSILRTLV